MTALIVALALLGAPPASVSPQARVMTVGGHTQTVQIYGTPGKRVAVVSSGDGGWVHLAPHVAQWLAGQGWYVLGFDSRAYLSSCSQGPALSAGAVGRDYTLLVQAVAHGAKPLLIGVSEGAGLSVVAASSPLVQSMVGGVITLGLGELNERAWHWPDSVIYLTKGVPREPMFHASEFVPAVSPVPLAFLRSSHDEYVSRNESDHLVALAHDPVRVWTIPSADHRFSDSLPQLDLALTEALQWVSQVPRNR